MEEDGIVVACVLSASEGGGGERESPCTATFLLHFPLFSCLARSTLY